ncbi:MAG: hypothetical protein KDD55_01840, partial [Bdellovibrionales bacterium]|nr:hypothetical protein [Bdellovibrionales bacterium]
MVAVRTRFAPSPTGMLHIGGVRTALYAWLLARHHGGEFLLRIEDTDRERKVDGAIQGILDCFSWFGLDIDEGPTKDELLEIDEEVTLSAKVGQGEYGPYIQSLRTTRYQEVCQQLIDSGHAFRCDCTPEMLDKEREAQKAAKEQIGYGGRCRERNVSADTPHVVRFKMPENPDLVLHDG